MEQHRLEKCNKLREMGLNPYVNSHIITSPIADILEKYSSSEAELPEGRRIQRSRKNSCKKRVWKNCIFNY